MNFSKESCSHLSWCLAWILGSFLIFGGFLTCDIVLAVDADGCADVCSEKSRVRTSEGDLEGGRNSRRVHGGGGVQTLRELGEN